MTDSSKLQAIGALNADRPIQRPEDDALGYWPFAKAIAEGIVGRSPTDGFVLGVQAQWGMGKTSAVNLILRAIEQLEAEKAANERTQVQWFNPWLFSGVDALARGYLSQLGAAIAASLDQTLGRKSRRFLENLAKGGSEFVGGAAALGVVAATGGAAIPLAASVKSGVSGAVSLGSHVAESRSLDKLGDAVRRDLQKLPHRILIILDDLDRLERDELKQVFTLVKTFGNLPQVNHLLVYDREIIDKSLKWTQDAVDVPRTPTFLEKIVQVEFDLPHPSHSGLIRLMNEKVGEVVGDLPGTADDNWFQVWQLAYTHYLRSPRDIIRFSNSFSVVWPSVKGEVYIPDFIAVELFRHYERATYDQLKLDAEFLTGKGLIAGDDERKERAQRLLATVPESRREDVQDVLRRMFPVLNKYLQGWGSGSHVQNAYAGRPIHTPEGFDSYFRLSPRSDELTVAEINELSHRLDEEDFLRSQFDSCMARPNDDGTTFAANLLDELAEILATRETVGPALLNILLEKGDQLLIAGDRKTEFLFPVGNERRIARLAARLLPRLESESRFALLTTAFARPESGPSVTAFMIAEAALPFALIYETEREGEHSLTEEQVRGLGSILLEKIQSSAANGTLASQPELWMLLKSWRVFGDPVESKAWIATVIEEPLAAQAVIFSTMSRISYTKDGEVRGIDRLPDPEIYDIPRLLERARVLRDSNDISPNAIADLGRFIEYVEAKLAASADADNQEEHD